MRRYIGNGSIETIRCCDTPIRTSSRSIGTKFDKGPVNERERDFLEAFDLANLGDGVGIHVYGPNGRSGQCGLGFRHGVRRLKPEVLKDFQWVCQLAHLRYCAMLVPMLGRLPELSMRETEVLAWVARGKSNSVIGEILRHFESHCRRAPAADFLKLGVFDRISAAVRGIGVGLIHGES